MGRSASRIHAARPIGCRWTILDSTPEGRGSDWYPKLDYPKT